LGQPCGTEAWVNRVTKQQGFEFAIARLAPVANLSDKAFTFKFGKEAPIGEVFDLKLAGRWDVVASCFRVTPINSRYGGGTLSKKREADLPPFFVTILGNRLVHVYLNLPRFGFLHLRHSYLEDAVFVGGFDTVLLRGLRQGE
jgi:hypothetical protein